MWIMVILLHGVCLIAKNENGHARTRSTVDCDTEFLNEEVSRVVHFIPFHVPCIRLSSVSLWFMLCLSGGL